MKKTISLFFILTLLSCQSAFAACNCGSDDALAACTGKNIHVTVGQGRSVDFTWTFHSGNGQEAQCGQFANGDYWIAPANGASDVVVSLVEGSGSGDTYLDENPVLEANGFLDNSNNYGNHDPAENILTDLPLSFDYDTSLVAAIQRNEAMHGNCGTNAIVGSCIEAYHVLTVLDQVPPNAGTDILRPSIDETDKELLALSDFNFNHLPALDYIPGSSTNELEKIRQRWSYSSEVFAVKTFSGQTFSEGGRAFRANLLIDDYGAGVAQSFIADIMALSSQANTLAEKQAALAAVLTYGKDLYYAIYDGDTRTRNWGSGAAQSMGKFPPAVFFAAMANDPLYGNTLSQASQTLLGYADIRGPHELDQINDGITHPVWGDEADVMTQTEVGAYWGRVLKSQCFDGALDTCRTSGGPRTSRDPHGYIDGPPNSPGVAYMSVSAGPFRGFAAMAHLMPKACQIINYPPLIEYVDRITDFGLLTEGDPCAPPDPRENPETCDAFRSSGCEYYGLSNTGVATWGPVSTTDLTQCILNNSGGNQGQNGRFPHLNGTSINTGYPINAVEANWSSIRNNPAACNSNDIIFNNGFE